MDESIGSSDTEVSPSRRSCSCCAGLATCMKLCLLFSSTFLLFSLLGATAFVALCQQGYEAPASQAAAVPATQLGADHSIGWWSMPRQQPLSDLRQLQSSLYKQQTRELDGVKMSFGIALGRSAPELMFNATRLDGVWEKVPAKLRGVFWVKGDGDAGQELTVMQYSRWFENSSLLAVPVAPFAHAWPAGKAAVSKDGDIGFLFEEQPAELMSDEAILHSPARTFKFKSCPAGAQFCKGRKDLAYASVQSHPTGSTLAAGGPALASRIAPGWLPKLPMVDDVLRGSESFQELEAEAGQSPGSQFRQVEKWGVLSCDCLERSARLVQKIVDGEGVPVEPHYSDFVQTVGNDPLLLWTGWPSEEDRRKGERKFSARAMVRATTEG